MRDMKLINKYKLLARLFKLQEMVNNKHEFSVNIETVISNFNLLYPDIKLTDLKEVYEIPNNDGTFLQVREYQYSEYEKPYMDGYQELLDLQLLCNKHFRPEFRTMIGEKFWSIKDFKEYEVLYIQEDYRAEQIFLLINKEYNKEIIVKVNEWRCGHLQGGDGFYSSKNLMLTELKKKYIERYKEDMQRLERI